jgi:U3 small nucleolar RNA-associated protein 4
VLSTGDTSLAVWRIPEKPSVEEELPPALSGEGLNWQKVLEMSLRVQTNLVASAISDDGCWLAVSDAFETKLFWLQVDVRVFHLAWHRNVIHLAREVFGR